MSWATLGRRVFVRVFDGLASTLLVMESRTRPVPYAVFRPPKSIGVFDEGDVRSILNFMLHNYYRHWRLYKVCFTRRLQCTFTQVLPFGVEEPAAYRPLVELLPLGEAPPAVLEPEPEPEEEGGEAEDGEATGEEPPADEVA